MERAKSNETDKSPTMAASGNTNDEEVEPNGEQMKWQGERKKPMQTHTKVLIANAGLHVVGHYIDVYIFVWHTNHTFDLRL